MKFLLIPLLLCLVLPVAAQNASSSEDTPPRPLDALLPEGGPWQMTAEDFGKTFQPLRFDWLSERKDGARFFGKGLSLWKGAVVMNEAIIEFTEGKVARMSFSIFNRGDSGQLLGNREQFDAQIGTLRDIISKQLAVPFSERGKDRTSAVAAEGLVWMKPPCAYLLEYSYQREVKSRSIEFRPEFIRLRVAPVPTAGSMPIGSTNAPKVAPVAKDSLTANVQRAESGDVVITNVPMVDQGPKGYCAVATAERVFRYYGVPVDQHEMAQVADTGEGGGTSPTKMYEALKKLEARLRVRVRVLEDWDMKKFTDMVGDYNKEAKRAKKAEVSMAPRGGVIYIDDIYGAMEGELLKTARTERDRSGFAKFGRTIVERINAGVPVMWGVHLGLLQEPEIPHAEGGHMRLIIGYNTKTAEILYSDSWGADHALKRMPIANAYAMTTGMYYMEPMK